MARLCTAIFFPGWVILTLLFGIVFVPSLLSRRLAWKSCTIWVKLTLAWLRIACGIHSHMQGVPASKLIACKHQSAWDTLMLWRALGNPVFVLKRELYFIPIFGWFLRRTGQIAINRREGHNAFEQIKKQAPALLAQGRTLVIFPEGTRVRVGDTKPYRSGIARISTLLKLDVTPVAVNAGLFWPKHSLIKTPGHAILRFLAPLPACDRNTAQWMHELQTQVEQQSAELLTAAPE